MRARSLIGRTLYAAIQAYYRRQVNAKVLAHGGQFVDAKAYPPQFVDLVRLARLVRRRTPQVVWEFGSGWSTQFLAQALADNGSGKLYSLEASPEWAANTRRMLPPWLASQVELQVVELSRIDIGGTCAFRYSYRPPELPQLIYVDGPAAARECPGNAEIIDIEPALAPGCLIVVDGRKYTVAFLRRTLRRRWRYAEDLGPLGRFFSQFNQRTLELEG